VDVASLYVRFGPLVYRRCLRVLKSEAHAEDAMQDVFVRVLDRAEGLEEGGLSSLFFRMATQVSLNRLRGQRRRPETQDDLLLRSIADHAAHVDAGFSRTLLRALFAQEAPDAATMAVLHFVDGMTFEEVAREVGMSVSGVRKRLRTLRSHAEDLLSAEAP